MFSTRTHALRRFAELRANRGKRLELGIAREIHLQRSERHPVVGDRVKVEVSPYDLTRGRITFRHKN